MTKKDKTIIERQQTGKIALLSLLAALPASAAGAVVIGGDSVLWAQIQRFADSLIPEAEAGYTGIYHDFTSTWTNSPTGNVVVTDCDCPPPVRWGGGDGDGGGGGGGGNGDGDGGAGDGSDSDDS